MMLDNVRRGYILFDNARLSYMMLETMLDLVT